LSPKISTSEATPIATVVRSVAESSSSQLRSFCHELAPSASVPVILGSSPMTTSMAAPKRKPVMTGLERNWLIQPMRNNRRTRNMRPDPMVIAATSATASSLPVAMPAETSAPAATAASAELGPVAICPESPKMA